MATEPKRTERLTLAKHGQMSLEPCKRPVETPLDVFRYDSPVLTGELAGNDSGYFTPSPVEVQSTLPSARLLQIDQDPASTPIKLTDAPTSLFPKRIHELQGLNASINISASSSHNSQQQQQQPTKASTACNKISNNHQPHRFVSPHLIGHLVGRRRIDFMRELRTLDLGHLASNVMRLLSPCDLHTACQVSWTWRQVCLANARNRKRLRIYLAQRAYEKENVGATKLRTSQERADHLPLLLGETQNWLGNAASEDLSVPKEMARFMRFTEEAKNLSVNQLLDKCPRCSSPARVDPVRESGECRSMNGCGLVYCVRCHCERGQNHVCDSTEPLPSPPRRGLTTDSAAQKSRQDRKAIARKNLRRLLS